MRESGFELRLLEAILFAATEPLGEATLAERMPEGCDVPALLAELAADYEGRGIRLGKLGGRWAFRTADDLAPHMRIELPIGRKLSRAAVETLAIIAYHQPVTRTEVEEIRGVVVSKGTFDVLLDAGWIRPLGRRQTPGRPVTWGTSPDFLEHFGLESLGDLPGVDELKAAGLLDARPAAMVVSDRPGVRRQMEEALAPEPDDVDPESLEAEPEPSEVEEG